MLDKANNFILILKFYTQIKFWYKKTHQKGEFSIIGLKSNI